MTIDEETDTEMAKLLIRLSIAFVLILVGLVWLLA